MTKKKNPRIGSSIDDLWQELGIIEDITATAIKRTIAIQIENEMSSQNISKAENGASDEDQCALCDLTPKSKILVAG